MQKKIVLLLAIVLTVVAIFAWRATAQPTEQYRVVLVQSLVGIPEKQLETTLNTAARDGWQVISVMMTRADNALVVLRKP